jgi:aspartate-semialdehyde dehydrogenase
LEDLDLVINFLNIAVSQQVIPELVARGCRLLDATSMYRDHPDVPLIVYGVNEALINQQPIIAMPNCLTTIAAVVINQLLSVEAIDNLIVTSMQAVSGAGQEGIDCLHMEIDNESCMPSIFPQRIAYNVIPRVGELMDDSFSQEEYRFMVECNKIFDQTKMNIMATCVRVPVIRAHSISITAKFRHPVKLELIKQKLAVCKDLEYLAAQLPSPLAITNHNVGLVGRVRANNLSDTVALFIVGDQYAFGMAYNAYRIIKLLMG